MDINTDLKELLNTNNKNKKLNELEPHLIKKLINVKKNLENFNIDFDFFKKELITDDNILPGSIQQILIGCLKEKEHCSFINNLEIPYVYDILKQDIFPIIENYIIVPKTVITVYIDHDIIKFNKKCLKKFINKGINKIKIKYKKNNEFHYTNIDINNLKEYINKDNYSYIGLYIILFICVILFLHFHRNKFKRRRRSRFER